MQFIVPGPDPTAAATAFHNTAARELPGVRVELESEREDWVVRVRARRKVEYFEMSGAEEMFTTWNDVGEFLRRFILGVRAKARHDYGLEQELTEAVEEATRSGRLEAVALFRQKIERYRYQPTDPDTGEVIDPSSPGVLPWPLQTILSEMSA